MANYRGNRNGKSSSARRYEYTEADGGRENPNGSSDGAQAYSRRIAKTGYTEKRKKSTRRKKTIIIVSAVVLTLIVAAAAVAFAYIGSINSKLHSGVDNDQLETVLVDRTAAGDPFYTLLLGVDTSVERSGGNEYSGDEGRSDTIILARIDPGAKQVTLVSIHRDTQVNLGEYGTQKINAAYSYGGPELLIKTVSKLAGVDIAHYVEVDFDGFGTVVDRLGGIEVDVPVSFYDNYLGGGLDAGLQTLNGDQALILCRSRHAFDDLGDGDVFRARHQRLFITALADKLLSSDAPTLASSISGIADCISTDMEISDIITLAQSMRGMNTSEGIYSAMCPTGGVYTDGVWYEFVNEAEWKTMMDRVDAGLSPTAEETTTGAASGTTTTASSSSGYSLIIHNGAGIGGAAASAASILESAGYTVSEVGDADASDYSETMIIYDDAGKASTAEAIAAELGVGSAMINDGTYSFSGDFLIVIGGDWDSR